MVSGRYKKPKRNLSGIPHEQLRQAADLAAIEMDDEVSEKYYDHWRHGVTSPWGPFDTKGDPAQDKEQFELLQTMIQDMYLVMFHKINKQMHQDGNPAAIHTDQYRWRTPYDDEGNFIKEHDRVQFARDRMNQTSLALGVGVKQMTDHYRKRTKELAGYDFPDWSID